MMKSALKGLSSNYFKAPAKKQLLNSAVIYGPNASGKSGFLRAFKALEFLVDKSASFKPDKKIGPYEPFRLDRAFLKIPVVFEISFIVNKYQYDFKVSFTEKKIVEEELFFYPNGAKTLLYSRVNDQEVKFGDAYRGPKKTLEKLLLPNQLLLSKAAENNVETLLPAYRWFANDVMVYPFIEDYHEDNLTRLYAERLADDVNSGFTKRFNALICALDTGIAGVFVEAVDWEKFEFPGNIPDEIKESVKENYRYDIKTQHPIFENNKNIGYEKFDVDQESTGTRSLFVIGGIILDALESGRLLIVDEFEKTLHPKITQYLIRLFHNPLINPHNAQLIFATHDVTQLSNETFRRDQVWFTEKDEFGSSKVYRCSDIQGVRLNVPLDKWYESGRFGAVPSIKDANFLITMQS